MGNFRLAVLLSTLPWLATACGRPQVSPTPHGTACVASPGSAPPFDSAAVAVTWAIDPARVTRPTNPGEQFVFAHTYEPLVAVDCLGRPMPRLAQSWSVTGGRVTLVLRDSARFWTGDIVTAQDVIASWARTAEQPWAVLARRVSRGAVAIGGRMIEVDCGDGPRQGSGGDACQLLPALGDPELTVTRPVTGMRWPEGTGPYRPRELGALPASAGARTSVVLEATTAGSPASLVVHSVGVADARDLIDRGIGLLLTEDRALAAYASARADVASVPSGWNRAWVLMTPVPRGLHADSVLARTVALRTALARDVVPADARAAHWPDWWSTSVSCAPTAGTHDARPARTPSPRIVARSDEPVARAIAERLVALAAGRSDTVLATLVPGLPEVGSRVTAIALAPNDFRRALGDGGEAAYVVALARRSLAPCVERERLRAMAPWLADGVAQPAMRAQVAPLVETRPRAVVRRDWFALTMTWDSSLVLSRP